MIFSGSSILSNLIILIMEAFQRSKQRKRDRKTQAQRVFGSSCILFSPSVTFLIPGFEMFLWERKKSWRKRGRNLFQDPPYYFLTNDHSLNQLKRYRFCRMVEEWFIFLQEENEGQQWTLFQAGEFLKWSSKYCYFHGNLKHNSTLQGLRFRRW